MLYRRPLYRKPSLMHSTVLQNGEAHAGSDAVARLETIAHTRGPGTDALTGTATAGVVLGWVKWRRRHMMPRYRRPYWREIDTRLATGGLPSTLLRSPVRSRSGSPMYRCSFVMTRHSSSSSKRWFDDSDRGLSAVAGWSHTGLRVCCPIVSPRRHVSCSSWAPHSRPFVCKG